MEKNPVSKSIILVPLILVIIFTLIGFWLIYLHFNRNTTQKFEQNLLNLAESGARMVHLIDSWDDIGAMDYYTDKFAKNSKFRATIIDEDGTVLGDSGLTLEEIMEVENHGTRPEIMAAKEKGTGISMRFSSTIEQNLLYAAVAFKRPGFKKAFLRVAMPLADLEAELRGQGIILWGFCFVALIVACLLSLLMSRYLLTLVRKGKLHLEEMVAKRTNTIEVLQNLATQLTVCNSTDEALEVIKLVTLKLLPEYTGAMALFRASKDKLEIAKSWNGEWRGETVYTPDQCWALRTGRPHIGSEDTGTMACAHSPELEGKMICVPLVAQGETHGVLHFYRAEETEWTQSRHRQIMAVGEHASLALANLRLRESLRQQAIRDPLTGLYNRRYLHETMENEISRAERHQQHMGVLMLDLDKFKKFNDEHGHEIGDFILSEFGRLIRTVIRNEDIACRYGGEEFTMLFPESDIENTRDIAEKIRVKVREHGFLHKNHSYGPITVSIGAACYPADGSTADLLLKNADDALYKAKQSGRDQVAFATPPEENSESF